MREISFFIKRSPGAGTNGLPQQMEEVTVEKTPGVSTILEALQSIQ